MTAKKRTSSSYYYADGKRVRLEVDRDHIAIDLPSATSIGQSVMGPLRSSMSMLPGGTLAMVARAVLPKGALQALESIGALRPVYRAAGARIVAYPEIRVDVSRAARDDVMSAIEQSGIPADMETTEGGEMTVRPKSGRGADALSLANCIHERARPASAQVRFVRIVPRPQQQQPPPRASR